MPLVRGRSRSRPLTEVVCETEKLVAQGFKEIVLTGIYPKKQFKNKKLSVLIEGRAKDDPSLWEGYSGNYIKVLLKSGFNLKNKFIAVKINK